MNKFMGLRGMLVDADALRGSGQAVVLGIRSWIWVYSWESFLDV